MKCVFCGCEHEMNYGKTTDLVDFEGHIIIIKNVPCMVCRQCGEEFYDNEVHKVIQELFNKAKSTLYDYAEIDYEDTARVVYKLVKVRMKEDELMGVAEKTHCYGK